MAAKTLPNPSGGRPARTSEFPVANCRSLNRHAVAASSDAMSAMTRHGVGGRYEQAALKDILKQWKKEHNVTAEGLKEFQEIQVDMLASIQPVFVSINENLLARTSFTATI